MAGSATITWAAPSQGAINQLIQYRTAGSNGAFTTYATVGPTVTSYPITLTEGNYEWQIVSVCANNVTTPSARTTHYVCSCPTGYTKSTVTGNCQKTTVADPNIIFSNYCLAPSQRSDYTEFFTRVYNTGFSYATIPEYTPSRPQDVYAQYTTPGQWTSTDPVSGIPDDELGPLNRASVWVDTDCDGIKDGLIAGSQTTISYAFNNATIARRMYVGIAADNLFTLKVNGVEVAKVTNPTPLENFKIWNIFPVDTIKGWNYFNAIATSDGTVQDAVGMVIYDVQTPQAFDGSHSSGSTYDTGLNILFTTAGLRGGHIDVVTCDDGYSLDTTGGQGNYVCKKIEITACS